MEADERKAEVRHRSRRRDLKGKHLWNGCGSEAGKDERKRTEAEYAEPDEADGKPAVEEGEKGRGRKKPKPGREPL